MVAVDGGWSEFWGFEMNEWVRASDELPPYDTQVWVAIEFDGPGDWRYSSGALDSNMKDGNSMKWWVKGASWDPSHWKFIEMPK